MRECEKEVCRIEGLLEDIELRVKKGGKDKEARRELVVLTEALMKVLIELDCLEGEEEGGWKGERKALVKRVQMGLQRCDTVREGVDES